MSKKMQLTFRVIEVLVIIATIILTPIAIKYATLIRGYKAIGGEYFLPIFALIIVLVIETIYEESESKNNTTKKINGGK